MATLARKLRLHDYFALAFGTMIGTGWLILMDDWLGRGGNSSSPRPMAIIAPFSLIREVDKVPLKYAILHADSLVIAFAQ